LPGIYEHAAALIGELHCRVSRDSDLLFKAQKAAWELYRHPILVAGIDVYNLEPKAVGADLDSPHCILGGNLVPVLPELLAPGFLICPSETDQSRFVDIASHHPQVAVRINMPVAAVLTGEWEDTRRAADQALSLARKLPLGFVGTRVVPFNARPELLLKLRDYIYQQTL
jgi:hypothetical protein